jgi:hypothetical protein
VNLQLRELTVAPITPFAARSQAHQALFFSKHNEIGEVLCVACCKTGA